MKFEFEKFVETNSSFAAKVTVRQKTGQIGFNSGAINRFGINTFRFGILYFDPSKRVVGLQLVNDEQAGAITISKKSSNTYITAKNFLDKYGIDYQQSHRHDLHEDSESGILYFYADEQAEPDADCEENAINGKDDNLGIDDL